MVRRPCARSSRCSVGVPPAGATPSGRAPRPRPPPWMPPRFPYASFMSSSGTLPETVREAARRFGDRTAYVDDDGRPLTYAELDRISDRVAVRLASLGVTMGSVVALVLPPSL